MTSEIAVRAEIVRADAYEPRGIEDAWSLAETLFKSGVLGRGLVRPEAVLYSLIAGRELGLTATQSLRSLHVVEGKIVLSADLIVALIKRNKGVCKYFRLVESTPVLARYETHRVDEPGPTSMTWTLEQATKAGLTGKDNWRKYPDAMLRARCSAYLARAVYPDLAMGMYDPDEADEFDTRSRARARSVAAQAANTQTVEPIEAEATPVTPLDYLRDDLASASTPEGIRASYETHAREIAEMDEDGSAIRAARNACHEAVTKHGFGTSRKDTDRILGKGERPVVAQPAPVADAPQSWREASLADLPSDSETTRALLGALRDAGDAAKVIACWREARDEVKSLPEKDAKGCFDALVARWAQLMPTDAYGVAEHAVREALKSPPDGPKPGTRKPATKPAADAQGSSAEAAPSAGPQARAPHPESAPYVAADGAEAWAARVARYTNTIELRRSWERHAPAFRAAGVLEARRAVSVARLQALASIDDEGIAQRVLDDAERAADAAARVTSTARRTGRSEISVRREARDAAERTLRKVA